MGGGGLDARGPPGRGASGGWDAFGVEAVGDRLQRQPVLAQRPDACGDGGAVGDGGSAGRLALGSQGGEAGAGAVGDRVPLPLRDRGDHVGDQPPAGGRCVYAKVERHERRRGLGEPLEQQPEVDHRARQPVELRDDQAVRFAGGDAAQRTLEAGPLKRLARQAFVAHNAGQLSAAGRTAIPECSLLSGEPPSRLSRGSGSTPPAAPLHDRLVTAVQRYALDSICALCNASRVWEVEYTDEFEAWWETLSAGEQAAVAVRVELLEQQGPKLRRPVVGKIESSAFNPQMKELRVEEGAASIRVLFMFDPRRTAILLTGGDKAGAWQRWYRTAIPEADRLYRKHLEQLQQEGVIPDER